MVARDIRQYARCATFWSLTLAILFDAHKRIVPTWLAATLWLDDQTQHMGRNLLLEMESPLQITAEDREVIRKVDGALLDRDKGLSIDTVASTIFPQGLYKRFGGTELYDRYRTMIDRAAKPKTWGTYFDRMTRRETPSGKVINPLENLIVKIRQSVASGRVYQSAYELPSCDPAMELSTMDYGAELGTYDPARDAKLFRGGPCLSHVSFKITSKTHVDMTAVYRSHTYCSRALGNLIGLGRLLHFVASETELEVGVLSCLSTHAELDLEEWGTLGKPGGKKILSSLTTNEIKTAA